jgi:hypothetical protein
MDPGAAFGSDDGCRTDPFKGAKDMIRLTRANGWLAAALSAGVLLQSGTSYAQSAASACKPPQVIPLTAPEPAPRLVVDAPLAEPLASRGVVVIPYCAENMRIVPVFGPGALAASPRVGHVHVTVDETPWLWADASGTPVILQGLTPGRHTVRIQLVNANHQVVDKGVVTFEVPSTGSSPPPRTTGVE